MITVICSYCNKIIEKKDGKGVSGISHGCCEECYKKEMEKMKK
jgi:hypothetical protein